MSDMQTWLGLLVMAVAIVGALGTWMQTTMNRQFRLLAARIDALERGMDVRLSALEADMQLVRQRIIGSAAT